MKPRILIFTASLIFCSQSIAHGVEDISELSLEQLLAVRVVGASKYEQKQTEVAAAVSVITRNQINAFGWRTLDEALASLPGIYTTYNRQNIYLGTRGFGLPGDFNMRALVLINGNRANDPTFDGGPFGLIFPLDMDLIERIEFIAGPGGAVYGQNAMSGVVNVITRRGATMDGAELAVAYQSPQAQREGRVSWGKLFDNRVDVLVSASGMRARGENLFLVYPGAAISSGVAAGLDAARNQRFFARIGRGGWSLEHLYGNDRKDDPTGAFHSDPLVSGQYQDGSKALTQLLYQESRGADTLHLSARLFTGEYRYGMLLSYGTPMSFPAWSNWVGAEVGLVYTGVSNHKLMLGLEAQDNTNTEQKILTLANPAYDIVLPGSDYRAGLYAQDEWRLSPAISSTLGLRLDRNDATGTRLSPRVAIIWQATPVTILKALYGRAQRAPNAYERDFDEAAAQTGHPAFGGEAIRTRELVADHLIYSDLALRGSIYQWNMRGLVTQGLSLPSGLPQYHNGEEVEARGVELSADKTWRWGGRLNASLAVQNTNFASGTGLANSPRRIGKLNFSAPLVSSRLHLGYQLQYFSERKTLDGVGLGPYWLSNLNLTADKWASGLELSLGLWNLFDRRYEQPAAGSNWQNAFEQDGRSVRVKLDYRF